MTPDDLPITNEEVEALLPWMTACDERLTRGEPAVTAAGPPLEPAWQEDCQQLQACMELLHRAFSSADTPPHATSPDLPAAAAR